MPLVRKLSLLFSILLFLAVPSPLFAHILVQAPSGGVLAPGTTVQIEWLILITHDVQEWDVSYSRESIEGPYVPIALGLPPGDTTVGTVHTLDWTVPLEAVSPQVWIKVHMDNITDDDLDDFSDESFAVGLPGQYLLRGDANGDGVVNIADAIRALGYLFGSESLPCFEAVDTNDDGQLNVADPIALLTWMFTPGSPAPAAPFPACGEDPSPGPLDCLEWTCLPG